MSRHMARTLANQSRHQRVLVNGVSLSAIREIRSAPGNGAGPTYVPFVHKRYQRKQKGANWPLRGRRGFVWCNQSL